MKNLYALLLLLLIPVMLQAQIPKNISSLKVIILRHAEKPATGDNLSCKGFNRSLQLPAALVKQFGVPNYIYVPAPSVGKATKSGRMLQTISPLAIKYNLSVNTNFTVDQTADLGKNILKKTGTIVVVWEHDNLPGIVKALGITRKHLKWPGNDYDSIWLVTITHGKAVLTLSSEGITPKDNCMF